MLWQLASPISVLSAATSMVARGRWWGMVLLPVLVGICPRRGGAMVMEHEECGTIVDFVFL